MPVLDIDGRDLYYEVHGSGDPLLCIHGLSVDTLGWLLQVPAWSPHYQTVIFDNRDVGQSSAVEAPYGVADMAADALALADKLELDRFHLLGVSMGGAIAQELALAAPERIRSLTLCVTFGGAGAWAQTQARLWSERVRSETREQRVEELMLLCFSERFYEHPEQVAFLRTALLANPHPQSAESFVRQLEATARHEARERLRTLDLPVHVIGAEHDVLLPVWKSRELAELIPGARLTVIDGAPHGLNIERAEEFNAAVLDFLSTV